MPGFFRHVARSPDERSDIRGEWCSLTKNALTYTQSRISLTLMRATSLKTYKGFPHGMPTTEAATINEDLLAFLRK